MNFTPFQKNSLFGTPSSKKVLKSSHNTSHIKSLQRSLLVNNSHSMKQNENPHSSDQIRQQNQIKEQTENVMKQLSMSYLYAICENFQVMMQRQMKSMVNKIVMLEWKIAQCQKKFNSVELQLHKNSKQFGNLLEENIQLIQLNRNVELRMQQLKQKYQVSYSTVKNEWMTNLVQQFRNQLGQFQFMNQQCESCQKGIKERLKKEVDKLENLCTKEEKAKSREGVSKQCDKLLVIKDTLKSTLEMIFNSQPNSANFQLSKWKQVVLQNIDLKFQVIEMREKQKYFKGAFYRTQPPNNSGSV